MGGYGGIIYKHLIIRRFCIKRRELMPRCGNSFAANDIKAGSPLALRVSGDRAIERMNV